MVLWPLNMLLQCCYSRAELHARVRGGFYFGSGTNTATPFRPPSLISTGGGDLNIIRTPLPPRIILDGLQPLAGRLCVCVRACVSVFLWLCWRPCSGCGATTATDPTRCVLSATPAPPPGPGSASNPAATSAAICGQIEQTDQAHRRGRFN